MVICMRTCTILCHMFNYCLQFMRMATHNYYLCKMYVQSRVQHILYTCKISESKQNYSVYFSTWVYIYMYIYYMIKTCLAHNGVISEPANSSSLRYTSKCCNLFAKWRIICTKNQVICYTVVASRANQSTDICKQSCDILEKNCLLQWGPHCHKDVCPFVI